MPRNTEIKVRVDDFDAMRQRILRHADSGPTLLRQTDTFFLSRQGRLKLRQIPTQEAELIYYERPDACEPTASFYSVIPAPDPEALKAALAKSIGIRSVVEKSRELFMRGRTRIHLDRVAGLGDFLELEVVLRQNESEAAGRREADLLIELLAIKEQDLVESAYVDLLEQEPRVDSVALPRTI